MTRECRVLVRRTRGVVVRSVLAAAVAGSSALGPVAAFAALRAPLLVVNGDFDGDGQTDRVQGFPEASQGAGRVDVFWGTATFKVAWPTVLSAVKDPATMLASGRLGESLTVGDFNGDGVDDLAIGAPHTDTNLGDPTEPNLRPEVLPNTGSVVVILGCPATRCAAVDSRGAGRAAVGSPLDPSSAAGAIRILPTRPVSFGRFGKSVAAGDFNGDGFDDLAIGSPGDLVGDASNAGSVTIVYGSARGLDLATREPLHQDLLPGTPVAEEGDHFGEALAAARLDLDGDHDLVVGVPDEDYGEETNAGEVDVFWGGPGGVSATNHVNYRHAGDVTGGSRSGDRLGHDLRALNNLFGIRGLLLLGLAEATSCGGRGAYLSVPSDVLGTEDPAVTLECDADICSGDASTLGDGALPEIPVNFVVIANSETSPVDVPTAEASFPDPITGASIVGETYFKSMVELLNQQLRADDGDAICVGTDCLRLAYRSHKFYSFALFAGGVAGGCPKLHAIAKPADNVLAEDPRAFTSNCDSTTCPKLVPSVLLGGKRYASFSDFAEAAVDECTNLMADDALNVILYDECERDPGGDGKVNTSDDVLDCPGSSGGRARVNGNHPYMFVDTKRALKPRAFAVPSDPDAAEEHEAGHAFGLGHACDCGSAPGSSHVMQTPACCGGLGARNLGFATVGRPDVTDFDGDVIEVEAMIRTARDHIKTWCP